MPGKAPGWSSGAVGAQTVPPGPLGAQRVGPRGVMQMKLDSKGGQTTKGSVDIPRGGRKGLILKNSFGSSVRGGRTWTAEVQRSSKAKAWPRQDPMEPEHDGSSRMEGRAFGCREGRQGGNKGWQTLGQARQG